MQILGNDIGSLREGLSSDGSAVIEYLKREVGIVFSHVLENAGVYKQTEKGLEGFSRFISLLE